MDKAVFDLYKGKIFFCLVSLQFLAGPVIIESKYGSPKICPHLVIILPIFFSSEQWEYPLQFFYLLYSQWEIICPALLFLVGLQLNSKCTFGLGKKSAAVSGEEWYFEPAGFTLLFSAKPTQEENTGYFSKGSLQGGLTNNGLNASFSSTVFFVIP